MTVSVSSPASSGPAGSHFEGQVGAHYLLSMLTGTEARGLPGTSIDRIEFQRGAEGRPLDDVTIHAHDARGIPAVLEIQVKRSIIFSRTDPVFRAVISQIVKATRRADFWMSRYELAIATARTSQKIDGAYQDVLTWARQLGDAATFTARIDRPGSANNDMRTFVRTFKSHLRDDDAPHDDETVWKLLRRLQILVFDFTAQGSTSEDLAKERAVRALHPDDMSRAGNLWTTLIELALQVALSGGDRTRDRLIKDLTQQSFRLAGDRRNSSARAALTEASCHALGDIDDRLDDVMLTRHERIAAVHAALDSGRYVEIRGDSGVGKSGVLKHFAEQVAMEGSIIVLSPTRTTPRGWTAMKAVLGFDGTAPDLLTDLAGNGGAIIFVDNLDFFGEEERRTVVDLVREAAKVPGFAVITTARRNFGEDEPSWLPTDALDRLGRADPIVINELSEAEVEEIRHAAPRLAPLLSDTHPARDVTRNLYRLSRLASQPGDEPVPRTEVNMAEQWWQTADGTREADRRECARVLKALAEQTFSAVEPLNTSGCQAKAVDALIVSESLRDLGNDRVVFRHDVLREWAIANLLHSEPTTIERLSLDRPASAAFARGIELASCMTLEHAGDVSRWQSLLDRLSREGTHGSWRRTVLLALVRSEIGPELLTRVAAMLLANRASLLRELIRVVMAVDVEPMSKLFAAAGLDPTIVPESLNTPRGPSWHRLIRWLLSLGETLPAVAIPEVVKLYTAWSLGMLGHDPLTPLLLERLYQWLTKIESARDADNFRDRYEPFGSELNHDQIRLLESDLRTGFLSFCNRTPALAVEYLRSLGQRRHSEEIVRGILKFRGLLAQAAPKELAELTVNALIPKYEPEERHHRREIREPFDFLDHDFLPASPTQGPFLDLLTYAPQDGLSLIHQLVDHAVVFYSGGHDIGSDSIAISLPDGERVFPWKQSYMWSRDEVRHYSVTSALMALEAWAHRRIEAGENFDNVLADVLGPTGSPTAYLLVAVDLLLSHWPKSREAAIHFLACPEILCIDRQRYLRDILPFSTSGIKSQNQPTSRGLMFEQLIGQYAISGPVELRETLTALLCNAAERLGPAVEQSDFGDPAFMATHALNLVDPNNWREVSATQPDGTQRAALQYVPPETEIQHLAPLQNALQNTQTDANMEAAISLALEDPSRSSPTFATAAVEWAQHTTPPSIREDEVPDEDWMRQQAVVGAAMIAMRDGDADLRVQHEGWARGIFGQAMETKNDSVHRFRSGLRYNPIAIAFVGMIHSLKDCSTSEKVRTLLEVATRDDAAAAHGFSAAATTLASIDERLPRAVLRCAFVACIRLRREWDQPEAEVATRSARHRQRVQVAIDAELAWLADIGPEPGWPAFIENTPRLRRGIRLPGGRQQEDIQAPQPILQDKFVDHQAAALWLSKTGTLFDVGKRPWLRDVARAYVSWTATANGAGVEAHGEVTDLPSEWNSAYFNLLAYCLPGLTSLEIEQLALAPIISLPDRSFFDVTTQFLRSVDALYFNDSGLQEPIATTIRSALARRMMASAGWKRQGDNRTASIEIHIGPAIAVFFFNDHGFDQPPNCYLFPKSIDWLDPFLPVLGKLVESNSSLFVVLATLNLLEVSPKSKHLSFIVRAAMSWLASRPDDSDFWVDHGIGRRVCAWIEEVCRQTPALLNIDDEVRVDVDRLLAALVSLGVAEARRLEKALQKE